MLNQAEDGAIPQRDISNADDLKRVYRVAEKMHVRRRLHDTLLDQWALTCVDSSTPVERKSPDCRGAILVGQGFPS
jgi:hypothetical protein